MSKNGLKSNGNDIIEKFIANEENNATNIIISEILKNPELKDQENDLIDAIIPLIKNILSEIRDKLLDKDFSKEDLSRIYFQETGLRLELNEVLEKELARPVNNEEKKMIQTILNYFQNLIIKTWFKF